MKRTKLSKKLKEESVYYLKKYLEKERPRRLSLKKRELIQKLIIKREKEDDKEAWKYVNSSLCYLAQVQLVREREAKFVTMENDKLYFEIKRPKEALVILKMLEIVNLAHDKGYGEILNDL